jgi:hypothetical protein
MRRMMTALACLALVAGSWSTAPAQDAEYGAAEYEGPMFSEIIEFDVSPADAAGFEMTMEKIVEAAKLAVHAGLSRREHGLLRRRGEVDEPVYGHARRGDAHGGI